MSYWMLIPAKLPISTVTIDWTVAETATTNLTSLHCCNYPSTSDHDQYATVIQLQLVRNIVIEDFFFLNQKLMVCLQMTFVQKVTRIRILTVHFLSYRVGRLPMSQFLLSLDNIASNQVP